MYVGMESKVDVSGYLPPLLYPMHGGRKARLDPELT